MKTPPVVPSRITQLASVLSQPQPMRRGSISERRMKCGKPTCPCQQDPEARHGPYFALTWAVSGRTHTRYLAAEQVGLLRRQIEAGRQFRADVEACWIACERWADEQLDSSPTAADEAAEKKGSARRSKRRSAKKSTRS
jgi:hypothetical protein